MPTGAQAGLLTYLQSAGQGLAGAFPALVNQDASGVAATPNELWIKNASNLYVPVSATAPLPTALTGSNVTDGEALFEPGLLFNETTYDRPRNNTEGTLLASLARTATTNSANQTNYNAKGVTVIVSVTVAGTGSLSPLIVGLSPSGATTYIILSATTLVTAPGKYIYVVYPGIGTASGEVTQTESQVIPRTWYVLLSKSDNSSWTYDVESFTHL